MSFAVFKEQVSTDIFSQDVFFAAGAAFLLLAVITMGFIDAGLVRRKNLLDTWVQKLVTSLIAGLGMMIVGYAVWQWQFYDALGVKSPLGESIKTWWIGGTGFRSVAQDIDPAVIPGADVLQIYGGFFAAWAALLGALLHSAGVERVKAAPMYIIGFVAGAVVMPILAYLTWGSASPLTNAGLHDHVGVFAMYILAGTWALILAWRAGPRIGALTSDPRTIGPVPHNLGWSAAGVGLLMVAIIFPILSCGYFVPGEGYFGISLSSSGIGIMVTNIFVAFCVGGLVGAAIAYKTGSPVMALLGPVAGYIACATGFDVYNPLETALVSAGGPIAVYLGMLFTRRIGIDESKIVPLTLFGGGYGAIVSGFVAWHTKIGGYFGATGDFAPQHAEITPWMQILGLGVTVGISAITGLALILLLEKTIGLRVKEHEELVGLDATYWNSPPMENDLPAVAPQDADVFERPSLSAR
jgi:ammonia channel protein AmtB